MDDNLKTSESIGASMTAMGSLFDDLLSAKGYFTVECVGTDGTLKWQDEIHNLVTTVGKNDILDKYLAGSSYTQTIVMGLKAVGTAVIADTQASHASWLEVGLANAPAYSGTRKTPAFSAAASGVKATSAAVSFVFTSGGTVAGAFINNGGSSTIDSATGVLFSAGDMSSSRAVLSGDTLNITYQLSV